MQRDVCHDGHSRHLFAVKLPLEKLRIDLNTFVCELRSRNIGATPHYKPLHLMPLYQQMGCDINLPVTEYLADPLVTLPISAIMTLKDAYDASAFTDIHRAARSTYNAGRASRA